MKKLLLGLVCLLVVGCGQAGRDGTDGLNGTPGHDGNNGHSIVTQSPGTLPFVCANGGSAVDLYMDMDDDLAVSSADVFQSTVFACNGANGADGQDGADGATGPQGPQGPTGPQGPAGSSGTVTVVSFPSDTTCRALGGGYYGQKQNSSSDNVRIYTASNCSGSYLQQLNSSGNEVYWTSVSNAFQIEGTNSLGIKIYRVVMQ